MSVGRFLGPFFQGRVHFVKPLARFGLQVWPQQRHKQPAKQLALHESNAIFPQGFDFKNVLTVKTELSSDKLHFF